MIYKIKNKIIDYKSKLQNKDIYQDNYLFALKTEIIEDICLLNKKNRKQVFAFKNFIQNNNTLLTEATTLFNDCFELLLEIEAKSFDTYLEEQRELYKKEFFSRKSFRAYKYFLKNYYQKKFIHIDIEQTLSKYFIDILKIDTNQAKEVASKQTKGRKSRNYIVELSKKVSLCEKKSKLEFEVLDIIKTKEIQSIININNIKYSRFMTAIQRKAFVVNDIFFNKILTHFILLNLDTEKLLLLRNECSKLI